MNNGIFSIPEKSIKPISNYGNTITKSAQMPCSLNNRLDWRILGIESYDAVSSATNATIADAPVYSLTRRRQRATFSGTALAYVGGVLMADGRIFLVPFASTTALIYDPVSDQTFVPAGTYSGTSAHSSAVLLPNNEILLIPRTSACRVYNPITNTARTIGSAPSTASAFNYGVLMGDGRVFCAPVNVNFAWIIDPVRNTVVVANGTYSNLNIGQSIGNLNGCVLLPNGKVLTVPSQGQHFFLYDPFINRTTLIERTGIFAAGALLLPDGKVLMGNSSANSSLYIYDWERNILRTSRQTVPSAILGMVLLPDGRIFCLSTSTSYFIYNYFTDTISTIDGTVSANAASSACLIPDGRVVPHTRSVTTLDIYGEKIKFFPDDVILSPFYNNRK